MKIIKLEKDNFKKAVSLTKKVLKNNGLVIIPSDTAYGLAANANSSKAVEQIFDFKGRKFGKGISVFLNSTKDISKYAVYNNGQKEIIKTLLPGPFTLILKSKGKTAPEIEPEDNTIGIRIINHSFVKELTKICPFPITATSANVSGKGPHYSINSFLKTLSEKKKKSIDLIIDAGKLVKKPTSTVVKLIKDEIKILRKGVLNPKLIAKHRSKSETETKKYAQKLYSSLLQNKLKTNAVVVILQGDLGAGKTIFAKGIGNLFNKEFTSPTFILMDEYRIEKPPLKNIYHLDLYRIETEKELLELKLEKLLKKGNLLLIEWGEKLSILQSLKKENACFYLIQIQEQNINTRLLKLYKI